MTRQFASLGQFADFLETLKARVVLANEAGLTGAAKMVLEEVHHELGHYQLTDMGPYKDWAPLSVPYTPNVNTKDSPGIVTGEMLESYGISMAPMSRLIGSPLMKALWFELGTDRGQAPRSVLGLALYRHKDRAARIVAQAVVRVLRGGRVMSNFRTLESEALETR